MWGELASINTSFTIYQEKELIGIYVTAITAQDYTQGLGCAFLATNHGLELWNIPQNRLLHQWAEITGAEYVDVSPTLQLIAVHRGLTIEFYPFDKQWLK